jgi:hypothetical protein
MQMRRSVPRATELLRQIANEQGLPQGELVQHPFGPVWVYSLLPEIPTQSDATQIGNLLSYLKSLPPDYRARRLQPNFFGGDDAPAYFSPDYSGILSLREYAEYLRHGLAMGRGLFDSLGEPVVYSAPIPGTSLALKIANGIYEDQFGAEFFIGSREHTTAYDSSTPLLATVGVRFFPGRLQIVKIQNWIRGTANPMSYASFDPLWEEERMLEAREQLRVAFHDVNAIKALLGFVVFWARMAGAESVEGIRAEDQKWLMIYYRAAMGEARKKYDQRYKAFGFLPPAKNGRWFTLPLIRKGAPISTADLFKPFDNGASSNQKEAPYFVELAEDMFRNMYAEGLRDEGLALEIAPKLNLAGAFASLENEGQNI